MKNTLRTRLTERDLTIGSWITLAHPSIAEIMCGAGFDWLAVDLEHSCMTVSDAEALIRTIDLCGADALVRLTNNDANLIKRVMDSGAAGIIVPNVNSVADAENAVGSVRYPPKGRRGVGLARAHRWGNRFQEYLSWVQTESIVIVQIEHVDALESLTEIFSVDGVDGCIIGPYDLSMSMGIPGNFEAPEFSEAIDFIKQTARDSRIAVGMHIIEPDPEELRVRIEQGYNFLAYSLDFRMIDVASRKIDEIKQETSL